MSNGFNEEYVKSALTEGIEATAIKESLFSMIKRSDELGINPKQINKVIQTVAEMKSSVNNKFDEKYLSNLLKENSEKVKSAITDGISSDEIAKTLVNSINGNIEDAKFLARLITTMKGRELSIKNNLLNKNSYQKVMTINSNAA